MYLVGADWEPSGMPAEKSIRYAMKRPDQLVRLDSAALDCTGLTAPAVVVWSPFAGDPDVRAPCPDRILDARLYAIDDRPVFYAGTVNGGRRGSG